MPTVQLKSVVNRPNRAFFHCNSCNLRSTENISKKNFKDRRKVITL